MKKYSLLIISLLFSFAVFSQKAVIDFEVKTHDFGKINEGDGNATYVFNFTNKGNSPLVVNRVQASCGCTTPKWTGEPIEPGKKGIITVTYNPSGRPGVFTKSITVYSNATEEQSTLMIKGEVIAKSADVSVDQNAFPVSIGDIRLKSKSIQFNNIDKGKNQERVIEIKNVSKNQVKVSIENLPVYISTKTNPTVLNANEIGKITLTFNSKLCSQWGPTNDEAYLSINGQKKIADDFQLRLTGNVIESFSTMTLAQKQKAPILEIDKKTVDFGVVKSATKKSAKVKLSNKGVNPLEIRRIINNNKEVAVSPVKLSIHNGKSGFITAIVDSKSLPVGDYKKTITIQTNDPDNSFIILVLNWKVEK